MPLTLGTGLAHPIETMISILALHLTAAAFRNFRVSVSPAARQVNGIVRPMGVGAPEARMSRGTDNQL
jgi:hypothetical protein